MKFDSHTGLIPAIIQDARSQLVLMMGYMNQESFDKTLNTGKVCFWSRSRQELWTKGDTSGNYLHLQSWSLDCDQDTLLIKVIPDGPCCHTGSDTCWSESNQIKSTLFLNRLQEIINARFENRTEKSYTSSLFDKGINKIAQKVGEEAVELVIESKDNNEELFLGEAADLMFHYLVLLRAKNYSLDDVLAVLESRMK